MMRIRIFASAVLLVAGLSNAQQHQTASETVSGRIICGDTQGPARFAQVWLQRVSAETMSHAQVTGSIDESGDPRAITAFDGSFVLYPVAPGDYYLMADLAGYLSERQIVMAEAKAGESVNDILAKLPVVHKSADSASTMSLTLERGGVIAGDVRWSDGTPANHLLVDVRPAETAAISYKKFPLLSLSDRSVRQPTFTDDLGRFRIVGLSADKYFVTVEVFGEGIRKADLKPDGSYTPLIFFAPGVLRRKEAASVTLHESEERDDVHFAIDFSNLHAISGHVRSADADVKVTYGVVRVYDATGDVNQMPVLIDFDGHFSLQMLEPGSYTLEVIAQSPTDAPSPKFTPVRQPLLVGDTDMTDLEITVPVEKPK